MILKNHLSNFCSFSVINIFIPSDGNVYKDVFINYHKYISRCYFKIVVCFVWKFKGMKCGLSFDNENNVPINEELQQYLKFIISCFYFYNLFAKLIYLLK